LQRHVIVQVVIIYRAAISVCERAQPLPLPWAAPVGADAVAGESVAEVGPLDSLLEAL